MLNCNDCSSAGGFHNQPDFCKQRCYNCPWFKFKRILLVPKQNAAIRSSRCVEQHNLHNPADKAHGGILSLPDTLLEGLPEETSHRQSGWGQTSNPDTLRLRVNDSERLTSTSDAAACRHRSTQEAGGGCRGGLLSHTEAYKDATGAHGGNIQQIYKQWMGQHAQRGCSPSFWLRGGSNTPRCPLLSVVFSLVRYNYPSVMLWTENSDLYLHVGMVA